MSDEANLDAYLKRINYAGSIAPTLETLEMVHRLHLGAVPFENLDPLMGRPVRLQLSDIEQKLLNERRGGYCFEQNLLFKAVLESMDFKVTSLAAASVWGHDGDEGFVPEIDHMALLVDVGGVSYLADVGFGGQLVAAPLRLRTDAEQSTPLERYRLTGGHPKWRLESQIGDAWRGLYEFTIAPQTVEDVVGLNDAQMTKMSGGLLVSRIDGNRRLRLSGNRLETHETGGTSVRALASVAELREALSGTFGIQLPQDDRLDPALERQLQSGSGG